MERLFRALPVRALLCRAAALGAIVGMVAGGTAGLIIGLCVHVPTAPFAAIELGLPATVGGVLVGLACGVVFLAGRPLLRRHVR